MPDREIFIKDTHRGLWYEDGVLTRVLEAGRYEIPKRKRFFRRKGPLVEVILVDMRERDLVAKQLLDLGEIRWLVRRARRLPSAVLVTGNARIHED